MAGQFGLHDYVAFPLEGQQANRWQIHRRRRGEDDRSATRHKSFFGGAANFLGTSRVNMQMLPARRVPFVASRRIQTMGGIFWTIILGFVIGVLAKLLHPGKENMGFIATVLLGIAGSFLAGVGGQYLGWYQAGEGAGFIASVVVAILLLVVFGKLRGGGKS